jgi:hypothetical protein
LKNEKCLPIPLLLSFALFVLIYPIQGASSLDEQQSHQNIKYNAVYRSPSYTVYGQQTTNGSQQLNVTFDSMTINNDHDPIFSGEWTLDVYVNGQRVQLGPESGLDKVNSGDIIDFTNKSTIITVPANGTLRIVTAGVEFDDNRIKNLTDLSGLLINDDLSFTEYVDEAANSISSLVGFDMNDLAGTIAQEYVADNNFGIGQHHDCSQPNEESDDLFEQVDTNCDFNLHYSIERVNTETEG